VEQLALDLAHKADIVQVRTMVTMRDRVRETDDLARLIMRAALHYPFAAAKRASGAVANELAPPPAAMRIEEELEHDSRGQRGASDHRQLAYRALARKRRPPASTVEQEAR
jgi:hypothetical protein